MATKADKFIDVLTEGTVRLIAKDTESKDRKNAGQRGGSYYITAYEDPTLRTFVTGSEYSEDEEKAKGRTKEQLKKLKDVLATARQLFIDDSEETKKKNDGKAIAENIPLTHLMSLNKANLSDCAVLNLMGISGVVAKDKKSFNGSEHYYFIEDAEADATEMVESLDLKTEAFAKIKQIGEEDYDSYIAYLLGTKPTGFSTAMKKKALLQAVDKDPAVIMKKLSVPDLATRLIIHKMIAKGVITHDVYNGKFLKGGSVFAHSFDEVLRYLLDEKNSVLLETWSKELSEA